MAVRLDYLENSNDVEITFLDKVLEGWANWTKEGRPGPQREQQTGVLLAIPSILEGEYYIRLSDDDFVHLEQCIKALPDRFYEIVELEYRCYWDGIIRPGLSQEQKWRFLGGKRSPYRDRLRAAQSMLYGLMMPEIEHWRERLFRKT